MTLDGLKDLFKNEKSVWSEDRWYLEFNSPYMVENSCLDRVSTYQHLIDRYLTDVPQMNQKNHPGRRSLISNHFQRHVSVPFSANSILVIITYQNNKKRVSRLTSYHPSENTEDNLEGAHSMKNHLFLRVD